VRAFLVALLVVEVAAIAWLVLNPSPRMPADAVLGVSDWLVAHRVPASLADSDVVEFCMNVALFVPLGFLSALLLPRVRLGFWILTGLVVSGALELFQAELLPARSPSVRDITANTLGMFLGAGAVTSVRWVRRVWRTDHPQESPQEIVQPEI
jgi:VanZ family protein